VVSLVSLLSFHADQEIYRSAGRSMKYPPISDIELRIALLQLLFSGAQCSCLSDIFRLCCMSVGLDVEHISPSDLSVLLNLRRCVANGHKTDASRLTRDV